MKKVGRNEKSHQKVKTNMYVEIGIKHEKEKFRAREHSWCAFGTNCHLHSLGSSSRESLHVKKRKWLQWKCELSAIFPRFYGPKRGVYLHREKEDIIPSKWRVRETFWSEPKKRRNWTPKHNLWLLCGGGWWGWALLFSAWLPLLEAKNWKSSEIARVVEGKGQHFFGRSQFRVVSFFISPS